MSGPTPRHVRGLSLLPWALLVGAAVAIVLSEGQVRGSRLEARITDRSARPDAKEPVAMAKCGTDRLAAIADQGLSPEDELRRADDFVEDCGEEFPAIASPLMIALEEGLIDFLEEQHPLQVEKLISVHRDLGFRKHYATHVAEAVDHYRKALRLAGRLRPEPRMKATAELQALLASAHADLARGGDYEEALVWARGAVKIRQQLYSESRSGNDSTLQRIYSAVDLVNARNELGLVLIRFDCPSAIRSLDLTRTIAESAVDEAARFAKEGTGAERRDRGPILDYVRNALGRTLSNQAECLRQQGDSVEAEAQLRRAIELRSGFSQVVATRLILGKVLLDAGRIREAEATVLEALKDQAEWLGRDVFKYGGALMAVAEVLEATGRYGDSHLLLREALRARRAVALGKTKESMPAEFERVIARNQAAVGVARWRRSKPGGVEILENALEAQNQLFGNEFSQERVETLIGLATLLAERDRRQANAYLTQAETYVSTRAPDGPLMAECLRLRSRIAMSANERLDAADRGVSVLRNMGASPYAIARIESSKASAMAALGRPKREAVGVALGSYHRYIPWAYEVMWSLRLDEGRQVAKASQEPIHVALGMLAPDDPPELLEEVWEAAITGRNLTLDLEKARLNLLKTADLGANPSILETRSRRALTESDARAATIRYARSLIESSFGAKPSSVDHRNVSLKAIFEFLTPSTALVGFYEVRLGDRRTMVAFVASHARRVEFLEIGDATAIARDIRLWREAVRNGQDEEAEAPGHRLRTRLWDSIASRLGRSVETVLVVPDGPLHYLPLEALPGDSGARFVLQEGKSLVYLLDEADLSVRHAATEESSVLAVGDVAYDLVDTGAPGVTRGNLLDGRREEDCTGARRFPRLPGTKSELTALRAAYSVTDPAGDYLELKGREALEGDVIRLMQERRFLHFATHAYAPTLSCYSEDGSLKETLIGSPASHSAGLALSGANHHSEARTPASDGLLTELEIAGIDLSNAELVVLSACETAIRQLEAADAPTGLRRAFLAAGARSVVSSLWPVPDKPTAQLMEHFYHHLLVEEDPTAQALATAKQQMIEDETNAYRIADWAGFVITGIGT